jgi:hypothetical protein
MLMQALLGFLPDAPRNKLYVDPLLPTWLPDLTIQDLRIGKHKFSIHFRREASGRSSKCSKAKRSLSSVVNRD